MSRREDHELEKVTLNLFRGEFERLRVLFPQTGAGKIVRELVHSYLRKVEERMGEKVESVKVEVNLEELR